VKAILVALGLAVYNTAANRWPRFHGSLYPVLNLGMTAALLLLATGPLGLTFSSIGLSRRAAGGVVVGAGLGLLPVLAMAALLGTYRGVRLLADRRLLGVRGRAAAYLVLVRIPIGTALSEEVAFRGVLLALCRPYGNVAAILASSLAFGLWHVEPGLNTLKANKPEPTRSDKGRAVPAAVILSAIAGVVLAWLRIATGNLGSAIGAHAAINSGSALVALAAHRRLAGTP
jgi:membrane protease YdiL (CAAX protease family)